MTTDNKKIKFCDNCGERVDEHQKFCKHCGSRIATLNNKNSDNINYEISNHNSSNKNNNEENSTNKISENVEINNIFENIIVLSVFAIISCLILMTIATFIIKSSNDHMWLLTVAFIVGVGFWGIFFDDPMSAGISGAITGLIVGLLQNHIISFVYGCSVLFVDYLFGNSTIFYLIIGIIIAVISNVFLGDDSNN